MSTWLMAARRSRWWRRRLAIVSAVAGGVLVISPLLYWLAEHSSSPDISGLLSVYTWLVRTLIEGGSPYDIHTGAGHVITYAVQVSGVALVATGTAAITTRLISSVLAQGRGMGDAPFNGHIVICGWSSKGPEILRELHAEEVKDKRPVVILVNKQEFSVEDKLALFVRGEPTNADDLMRAGIDRAECAIVLADESDPSRSADDIDARTLLTTLAIESVAPSCYTCVEVIRSANRAHFQRTKADELVVSAELGGALLAGSATTHGLSRLVSDLVTHPEGTEFYRVKPPPDLIGMKFGEALRVMKDRHNAILVAIFVTETSYEINPAADRQILEGEELLIITNSTEALGL
jgi:voltage-gated potassium channel